MWCAIDCGVQSSAEQRLARDEGSAYTVWVGARSEADIDKNGAAEQSNFPITRCRVLNGVVPAVSYRKNSANRHHPTGVGQMPPRGGSCEIRHAVGHATDRRVASTRSLTPESGVEGGPLDSVRLLSQIEPTNGEFVSTEKGVEKTAGI